MGTISKGILNGLSTLKDGTIKISISLHELPPEEIGKIIGYNNRYIKFYITDSNISSEIISELDSIEIEVNEKSPSKRLKNVFYRLWEQDNEGYEDSELYYRYKINKVIEHYKNLLT